MIELLPAIKWREVFVPSLHFVEIIVRGSLTYLGLFAMMRVVRREAGTISIPDLLMVVLIADAAQNAMSSNYRSITDGLILVATIIFWSYALDWLSYHSPRMRRLIQPKSLRLVQNGQMNRENMSKQLISKDDLMAELRLHGLEDLSEVKEARLEEDGHISVIKRRASDVTPKPKEKVI